jgi:hypothetical protein
MEFICKFCGKHKADANHWLVGLEGTKQGRRVMKYNIFLLNRWDDQRAQETNAVHFCSSACQEKYLSKNYGDETVLV